MAKGGSIVIRAAPQVYPGCVSGVKSLETPVFIREVTKVTKLQIIWQLVAFIFRFLFAVSKNMLNFADRIYT